MERAHKLLELHQTLVWEMGEFPVLMAGDKKFTSYGYGFGYGYFSKGNGYAYGYFSRGNGNTTGEGYAYGSDHNDINQLF